MNELHLFIVPAICYFMMYCGVLFIVDNVKKYLKEKSEKNDTSK